MFILMQVELPEAIKITSELPQAALLTLYGILTTAVVSIVAHLVGMAKHSRQNRTQIELMRLEFDERRKDAITIQQQQRYDSEERRKDAQVLLEQTKAEAALIAVRAEATAANLAHMTESTAATLANALDRTTVDLQHNLDVNRDKLEKRAKDAEAKVVEIKDIVQTSKDRIELHGEKAIDSNEELKALVKVGNDATIEGAKAAKDAYHEANQVNVWRADVNREIANLSEAIKKIAQDKVDRDIHIEQKIDKLLSAWDRASDHSQLASVNGIPTE